MNPTGVRATATSVLVPVIAGKSSLTNLLSPHAGRDDYALLQEICFGVCRWYFLLEGLLGQLLDKPLKVKDKDLQALLLVGLYQLRSLNLPDHAVLNESVAAVAQLQKPWAKALVNAVLRNYQRRRDEIEATLPDAAASVVYAHPDWLLECLQTDWPEHWQQLAENNNQRPPMTLRVNLSRLSRHAYGEQLQAQGITARPGKLAASSLYLDKALPVLELPGFQAGLVSVQDEASQLVAGLLALAPGQRLLDACAAPGGKTCHILESEPSLTRLVAIDADNNRLQRLQENLQRLQLSAHWRCADVGDPQTWWDGKPFNRILLDAPCSATGVIRRHPDIKLLRRRQDLDKLTATQLRLLNALWPCLEPGGLLLYTTCSLLRRENEATIAAFLATAGDAKYESIMADWGVECPYGRQLLTSTDNGPDGFFYALLRKT